MDCAINTLIPLSKAVSAALVDTYADHGVSYQRYAHWAARRFKTLARQSLRGGKKYVSLTVNKNTHTATLPADFKQELFVGYINGKGYKVGLPLRTEFVNAASIEEVECIERCPKCNDNKAICEDMTVTESTEVVTINGGTYTKTIIKKLYANGSYYLETTFPYYNTVTASVEYTTTKEFITQLDLKDCGCLETTEENIEKVRTCCSDVYGNYFATCAPACDTSLGGYRIMEDIGLIQLDRKFTSEKLYFEYRGFLPKINGQLAIPEVAFETVVKGTVLDAISGKRSSGLGFIQIHEARYRSARSAMDKEMGAITLNQILQAVSLLPKFDVSFKFGMDNCHTHAEAITTSTVSDSCEVTSSTCSASSGQVLTPFQLSLVAGSGSFAPVVGLFTFQSNELIGALNLNQIIVNNVNESKDYGDFTFDGVTGTLTRTNPWQTGDVVILPFAKIV